MCVSKRGKQRLLSNVSQTSQSYTPDRSKSQEIDNILEEERKKRLYQKTILLLGSAESGKSTVLKQMRLRFGKEFDQYELEGFRYLIHQNIFQIIQQIAKAMTNLSVNLSDPKLEENLQALTTFKVERSKPVPMHVQEMMIIFWNDPNVQKIVDDPQANNVSDAVFYWFPESISRIFREDYVPTEKDVLQTRLETLGVQEHEFPVGGKSVLKIVDVGGSKTQRYKWLQQFIHCNAVIFVSAINGYCQYMLESPTTLRIHDSMALFDVIINNQYLKHVPVILFLNKRDLFKRMIKIHPLTVAFPEYNGKANDVMESAEYLKKRYLTLNSNERRIISTHFTCATDKKQLQHVIDDISHFWRIETLEKAGLT